MATLLNAFFSSTEFSLEMREKRQRLRRWRETSNLENISTTTWKVRKKIRGRILGRDGDKSLKSCYSQSPFYSPPPCAKVV
jgi:hypothetical protein